MAYDNLDYYFRVPYAEISERWEMAHIGAAHPPWQQPPQIGGAGPVARLLVLTGGGHMFELPYGEFYRIMKRDNIMKLVFERGREEPILEFYGSEQHRPPTAKVPFAWLDKYLKPKDQENSNVIPFRRP